MPSGATFLAVEHTGVAQTNEAEVVAVAPGPTSFDGPRLRFTGITEHTLDVKSRIVIPVQHRPLFVLTGGYVVRWGRCLALMPPAEFDRWAEAARRGALTAGVDDPTELLRHVFAATVHVRLDAQGRIGLPDALRASVGIDKDVEIVGNDARLELWAPGTQTDDLDDIESSVAHLQSTFDLIGRD